MAACALRTPRAPSKVIPLFTLLCGAAISAALAGCSGNPDAKDIPPAEVKAVQAYGMTLHETATPQQVAFVLLRSIADDVHAAQTHNRPEQKAALLTTYSIAACSTIEKRLVDLLNAARGQARVSLGKERDQEVYSFVRQWAPIVAYYVPSFDTDFKSALGRMTASPSANGQTVHIGYRAWHSASASQPGPGDEPVLIDIELTKERGTAGEYWRVARVGFVGRARLTTLPAAPATATAPH